MDVIKTKCVKSIKEEAEEYGLLNPNIHYDANGNPYDDVDTPSIDFKAGANYVLEQIENLADKTIDIYNLIEQLKK